MPVVSQRARNLLAVLAGLLALATLVRLPFAWASGNGLNHVAGAWIALARDLADGVLYRPLAAEEGFGGTRFFPLWFALHGGLLALGAAPVTSGLALALVAGLAIPAAAYLLLRRLGSPPPVAAAFAVLVLAGFSVQYGLTTVRGDLLPVALQLGGLAAVAAPRARRRLGLAALAFVLAFAAKPTALAGALAAATWLHLAGDRRGALALSGLVLIGAGSVLLATDALSGGRFLEALRASTTGALGPAELVRAPVRLAETFAVEDRAGLLAVACAALALAAAARAGPRRELGLPVLWLVASAGALLGVFAVPGTGVNHLADVEAAAAIALGATAALRGAPARLAAAGGLAVALGGAIGAAGMLRDDLAASRVADARRALAAVPSRDAPILSEDPLVPTLAGDRPYLLDAFVYRIVAERDPVRARPLVDRLERGDFPAVVLLQDLRNDVDAWYARTHLGLAAMQAIRARYRLAERAGPFFVYLPSPARGPGDADDAAFGRPGGGDADGGGAALARSRPAGP